MWAVVTTPFERWFAAALIVGALGCRDAQSVRSMATPPPAASSGGGSNSLDAEEGSEGGAVSEAPGTPLDGIAEGASPGATEPPRSVGPLQVPFLGARRAFVVPAAAGRAPHRLIAMLHGVCNPPSYACGQWSHAASLHGVLVCPTGNAICTTESPGAPTWDESFAKIDEDLERAIAKVSDRFPGETTREGAILVGFSRGAYAAAIIAARHAGRWPFLILNEADTELSLPMLRQGKVRAVALIAGEWGSQVKGERKNADDLTKKGYPIRLWVMPKAGHHYSANIDDIMSEAIEFLVSHEKDGRQQP